MTALVWFSFPRDYGKLAVSVAHCSRLDPAARRIVVIESRHPRPRVDAEVVVSDFDRGSHLDGEDAVRGVARTLLGVDASLIVKIDSDMLPRHAFWLDGAVVFQRFNNWFVGLYALPREVFPVIWECLEEQPSPGPHEAQAIASRGLVACRAMGIPVRLVRTDPGVFFPEVISTIKAP